MKPEWVSSLLSYCRKCFAGTYLPSHDDFHHLRTWENARKLIASLSSRNVFSEQKLLNIALAAFLHDTGMSVTLGKNHGPAGRKLAEKFLAEQNLRPDPFAEALDAIEHHDDKEYASGRFSRQRDPLSVLQILSVADDLDALGAVGVFRYYEIYTLRGIPVVHLADEVLNNISRRYAYLSSWLEGVDLWQRDLEKKYMVIRRFYEDLSQQMHRGGECEDGPHEVLCNFEKKIRQPRYTLPQSMMQFSYRGLGRYAGDFFKMFFADVGSVNTKADEYD